MYLYDDTQNSSSGGGASSSNDDGEVEDVSEIEHYINFFKTLQNQIPTDDN